MQLLDKKEQATGHKYAETSTPNPGIGIVGGGAPPPPKKVTELNFPEPH